MSTGFNYLSRIVECTYVHTGTLLYLLIPCAAGAGLHSFVRLLLFPVNFWCANLLQLRQPK
jgi:hypothetical protein